MLNRTRLTFAKTKRCVPSTSLNAVVRRAAAFAFPTLGVLFLLNDSELNAAPPNVPRSTAAQSSDNVKRPVSSRPSVSRRSSQPTQSQRLGNLRQRPQELAAELSQLEFQFQEAQKIGSERLDQLTPQVAELLDDARSLAAQATADAELAERAQSFVFQLEEFQAFIDDSSAFFNQLAKLDAASLDEKATRAFFESFSSRSAVADSAGSASSPARTPYYNEVSASTNFSETSLDAYRTELSRAAASLDALQTLESWNSFVEARGSALERFYVAPEAAENALLFISQVKRRQGLPKEFRTLERRATEWRFTSLNRVAIQRKILLALEAELATKYWTFAAAPDKIYYLQQPPRPGRNVCFANSKGGLSSVEIPEDAPETATFESTQRFFLQELVKDARLIPETLRVDDAARWYAAWSAFLLRLQTTDALDPLVQFRLLRSVAITLSDGDFYFAQRLTPTLRILDLPQLVDADAFDVFDAENIATQELRRLAKARVAFLPTDRLTVDKTTEELDAQTERFSFVYRRVGWLDRDFSGAWRCRRPKNAPLPVGDLYVLVVVSPNIKLDGSITSDNLSTNSPSLDAAASKASPQFRWLKIGSSDGRQTTLEFATPDVCRGTIVLCRSRVGEAAPVAERGELERVLRR